LEPRDTKEKLMETEEKSLMLFDNPKFKPVRVKVVDGELWFVAKDLCKNLSIQNTKDALSRLDEDEKGVVLIYTPGGTQESLAVTEAGAYTLVLGSRKKEAHDFKRWITHDVVPSIRKTGGYNGNQPEVLERVIHLEELLAAAGILRPFVAPRYTMENLLTRYKQATGIDRVRTFYDDIGKWCGVKVPYANSIRIPVRDWIIINLPLEHVQELVVGFETHTMARSTDGYPVSLNGCFGNSVEWDRTLREFDHKCAYCGESHETLMAEHIVPQSVMAREHPDLCDNVFNIVPVCKTCNQSKGTSFMPTWFKKQSSYSDERYWKIQHHQGKYMLNSKG
jgi:prophage antirepressor-like protein